MDGARASDPYRAVSAIDSIIRKGEAETSRRAVGVSVEAWGAILGGAAPGADLGGSSKYSNENFED
jgi:hypothetical protein